MNLDIFQAGYDPDTYVRNLRNYRSLVRSLAESASVEESHVARLKAAAARLPQPVRATVMTEDWCGDSACNVPVLAPLFGQAGIELRIVRGSEQPELSKKYNNEGDDHIPVISVWDGQWNEALRWIEAPAAVDEMKNAWKAERPHFMELYEKQKSDKEAARQFASLYREFLEEMSGWYKDGMWAETTREIVEGLEKGRK